jgi:hypothetical protein
MSTTPTALLPCPFCGGEASPDGTARFSGNHEAWFADGTRVTEAFYCNCMRCGANNQSIIGGYQTRDKAIAVWNERASSSVSVPSGESQEAQTPTLNFLHAGADRVWCVGCKAWLMCDGDSGKCDGEEYCPIDESHESKWKPVTVEQAQEALDALTAQLRELDDSAGESLPAQQALAGTAKPRGEWHEDDGTVLWWHDGIGEPPFLGYLEDVEEYENDAQVDRGHYTHFTRIVNPVFPVRSPEVPSVPAND